MIGVSPPLLTPERPLRCVRSKVVNPGALHFSHAEERSQQLLPKGEGRGDHLVGGYHFIL